eukprot:3333509-Amphidinium_carterae.1
MFFDNVDVWNIEQRRKHRECKEVWLSTMGWSCSINNPIAQHPPGPNLHRRSAWPSPYYHCSMCTTWK